jgi:hypothetical protein
MASATRSILARPLKAAVRQLARAGLLAALTVTASRSTSPTPSLSAEDAVVVALRDEPETLFAPSAASTEALTVLGAMTEGLVVPVFSTRCSR